MKKIVSFLAILAMCSIAMAQTKAVVLKKTAVLQMPKTTDDDMPGTRGASVVWHPLQKKYYASFAGNKDYPMAVFNAAGKRLSSENQTTLTDTRGLWYDPVKKKICGNGYDETGWFSYSLNPLGLVNDIKTDTAGLNQPDAQSVGAYNTAKKQVQFLFGSQIWFYNAANAALTDTKKQLHWGLTAKDGIAADEDIAETPEGYNTTSVIYTGMPGAEAGVLNTIDKQIELYNIKTGFLTKRLQLPEDAPTEQMFNFAFANGMFWLFNITERAWIGYK